MTDEIEAYKVRCGGSQLSGEGTVLIRLIADDASAREVVLSLSLEEATMLALSISATVNSKTPVVQ